MPALIPAPTGIKTSPIKGYLRNFAPCSEQPLPPRCKYPLFLLKEPKLQTSIYPLTLGKKNRADVACLQPWSLFLIRSSSLSSTLLRMFLHTLGGSLYCGKHAGFGIRLLWSWIVVSSFWSFVLGKLLSYAEPILCKMVKNKLLLLLWKRHVYHLG